MSEKGPSMKDDYLWDGSGEPDPEVQKLETVLGRYRHNQPAPAFDQVAKTIPMKRGRRFLNPGLSVQLGAIAAILLLAVAAAYVWRTRSMQAQGPAWEVARIEGAPRVGWLNRVGPAAPETKPTLNATCSPVSRCGAFAKCCSG